MRVVVKHLREVAKVKCYIFIFFYARATYLFVRGDLINFWYVSEFAGNFQVVLRFKAVVENL